MKRLLILVVALCVSTMAMAQERDKSGGLYWSAATKTSCVLTNNIDKKFFTDETEYVLGYGTLRYPHEGEFTYNGMAGVHTPIIYGDYYYVEALLKLKGSEFCPW
jgi:hypothetical protein